MANLAYGRPLYNTTMTAVNCVINHLFRVAPHVVYRLVKHAVFVGMALQVYLLYLGHYLSPGAKLHLTLLAGLLSEESLNWDVHLG